jgi:hypothetical protein
VKVAAIGDRTHNPSDEACWVSRLRENLTSGSYGEGLETGRSLCTVPRQSFTRQVDLRHIKTTLGMETLSCKTPPMCEKEMWVYMLAYNLIRLLMAQAAEYAGVLPRQLSFKHTLQVWVCWSQRQFLSDAPEHTAVLFGLIAQIRVGNRPGRVEPRLVKRRPKPFSRLQTTRHKARENIKKHGRPKRVAA